MGMPKHTEAWVKRMAAQIASQLPEDQEEALVVLELAKEIVQCLGTASWPRQQSPVAPIRLVSDAIQKSLEAS